MTKKIIIVTLAMVSFLGGGLFLAGCDDVSTSPGVNSSAKVADKEKAAIAAAEQWLAFLDAGQYAKTHDEAASYFRGAVPKDQWTQQIQGVRDPLGPLKSRKVKNTTYATSLPGAPDGEYVVIIFEASFDNKASALETVTPMLDRDGQWRVSGYYIK